MFTRSIIAITASIVTLSLLLLIAGLFLGGNAEIGNIENKNGGSIDGFENLADSSSSGEIDLTEKFPNAIILEPRTPEEISNDAQELVEKRERVESHTGEFECLMIETFWAKTYDDEEVQFRSQTKLALWDIYREQEDRFCIRNEWAGIDSWETRYLTVKDGDLSFFRVIPGQPLYSSDIIESSIVDLSLGIADSFIEGDQREEYALIVSYVDAESGLRRRIKF